MSADDLIEEEEENVECEGQQEINNQDKKGKELVKFGKQLFLMNSPILEGSVDVPFIIEEDGKLPEIYF
ncbi:hypothetical protein PV328_004137 [Microctonus aethiopoides]|uniref:Uncharacterized protein n=1 Tax=Microctonus aethiopoides TaxID=144406 RepID=A0AA39F9V3_9HYME|nr:hypothetical protein PV328_004137 [Microctonus aethiopoides]